MSPERSSSARRRVLILGLDGVPPEFLFDRIRPYTPNLNRLLEAGTRAVLRTSDPPVSVPAWPVMFTGVDPGTLGIYGFRHRRPGTYTNMYIPNSRDVPVPTVWETLSDRGYRVAVLGMPLGYPPPPVNGAYISDFLTPSGRTDFTHPPELREELERRFGAYRFDVVFRSNERTELLQELIKMTQQRWEVAEWLYQKEPWDVFAVHEIGTDRLHHAYWKYFDRDHPKYVPGNPFENADREYYTALDAGIGRLLEHVDERTTVLVVSDHGSMAMKGCFCINEWLEQKGYLALKHPPEAGTPTNKLDIDWAHTTAWGEGGYYARIFFNVRGREPHGILPVTQVPGLRQQLIHDLQGIQDPVGQSIGARVLDPREVYQTVRGDAPDLMVYLDELRWRAAGTMGYGSLFLEENDTGPDDAVHSFDGVFLMYDPANPVPRELPMQQIRDITPTILELLGEPIPSHVQGLPISGLIPEGVEPLPTAPIGGRGVGTSGL
jgi:predicted AlkP superfamily phosphohydrolase/phosphomutase